MPGLVRVRQPKDGVLPARSCFGGVALYPPHVLLDQSCTYVQLEELRTIAWPRSLDLRLIAAGAGGDGDGDGNGDGNGNGGGADQRGVPAKTVLSFVNDVRRAAQPRPPFPAAAYVTVMTHRRDIDDSSTSVFSVISRRH